DRDDPATGIPTLIEILTEPVATRILRWLGLELQRVRLVTPSRVAMPTNGKHEPEPGDVEPLGEDEPEGAVPDAAPAVEIPGLHYWLTRIVRHIEPYTPMFPPDWPVMMSLPFWSILWPNVRIQNLNMAVWSLGLAPQGGGKNVGTDELKAILQTVSDR